LGAATVVALQGSVPVHVLRGLDDHARAGGDIDLIVPPGRAHRACMVASQAALENGWFLVGFRDIGYVCSVTLMKPGENASDEAVKLDFVNGIAWYGIGLDQLVADPFSPRWNLVHQAWTDPRIAGALTFFQKIMAAGAVTAAEWMRIAATGADSAYLAGVASAIGLPISPSEIEARKIGYFGKWRLRAASGGANSPTAFIVWFCRASIAHIKFKLGFWLRSGLVFGVSGLDGSGKSTLVNRFIEAYDRAGGAVPQLIHLLPVWLPMPHQLFRRQKTHRNYTRPYSEPPVTSKLSGNLRLAYYILAFTITKIALTFSARRGNLIILDRSILDFASDLTRARIPARRLSDRLLRLTAPKSQLFYLDASPETVVARKGELTLEKAEALQASYRTTSSALQAIRLDGDAPHETVFRSLLGHLTQEYLTRITIAGGLK
jgi:hypothetical protein